MKANRGVLCLYVVKPRNEDVDGPFQIGMEFLMPFNTFEKKLLWGSDRPGTPSPSRHPATPAACAGALWTIRSVASTP